MTDLPEWISFALVRGSWAKVGNDTDPYRLYQNVGFSPYMNGLLMSRLPSELPTKDLKPEINASYEVSSDLKFFKNRLGVDFIYYNSTSKDQLLQLPVISETRIFNFININT